MFSSFSKWVVTSVTLMALVLSSVAYSYPMKMEGMTMNMAMPQSQMEISSMSDCMPDCHSQDDPQSNYLQCDMSSMSMSMNNNDHCSDKGDNCCKTVCAVSVYALPMGLNTQINSLAFAIKYGFYNEQPRSFSSSSLYRPPIA